MTQNTPSNTEHDNNTMFNTVEEAILAIQKGKAVIIADDDDRENEGDFVCAAETTTPELINLMATHGRGLICLTLPEEDCDRLELFPMVSHNSDPLGTAFTVSIDAHTKFGVTTGISAHDRAKTIQVAIAHDAQPADLRRPGHIFPLRAKPGGVLQRVGHTEASVDLAKLAGLKPAGVICEILNEDGTMARRDQLVHIAKEHDIPFITVAQLIEYRLRTERMVERTAAATLPTMFGEFDVIGFRNTLDDSEHLALIYNGDDDTESEHTKNTKSNVTPLVRMHSECLTGDLLGSLRCDCGFQLHGALQQIAEHGSGALVYMRKHEGRGIGLLNKIKAYSLQDHGRDTVEANEELGFPADLRNYGVGAQILLDIGITEFNLLTNNPRKIRGLDGYGLTVLDRVPIITGKNTANEKYLATKADKLGHLLGIQTTQPAKDIR